MKLLIVMVLILRSRVLLATARILRMALTSTVCSQPCVSHDIAAVGTTSYVNLGYWDLIEISNDLRGLRICKNDGQILQP